jgi:nucleoside-diphosphate kinase
VETWAPLFELSGVSSDLWFITSFIVVSQKELTLALERTFAIIKPDAVSRLQQGEILARIHQAGFTIVAIKSMRLTKEEAGGFYAVHRERPFFGELTDFMSSGKIFAMVLEADGAIANWRDTMGATDPNKAAPGTIRHDLGTSIGTNCTHGSDAPETAAFEIAYFFSALELI